MKISKGIYIEAEVFMKIMECKPDSLSDTAYLTFLVEEGFDSIR